VFGWVAAAPASPSLRQNPGWINDWPLKLGRPPVRFDSIQLAMPRDRSYKVERYQESLLGLFAASLLDDLMRGPS
jgi:hypothetical protein